LPDVSAALVLNFSRYSWDDARNERVGPAAIGGVSLGREERQAVVDADEDGVARLRGDASADLDQKQSDDEAGEQLENGGRDHCAPMSRRGRSAMLGWQTMSPAIPDPPSAPPVASERWPVVKVPVPPEWKRWLEEAAAARALSVAALVRQCIRALMIQRPHGGE